jgi:hypothetical protein
MSSVVTGLSDCLNCGTLLSGSYCAHCGQKATPPNPTFHDFLHEFTHEVLHVDGRLWQSIKVLFTRPGLLTREHCQGRRARYLGPLRLYLTFSVLFFAAGAYVPSDVTVKQDEKRGPVVTSGGVKISGDVFTKGKSEAEIAERFRHAEHEWFPRAMFLLVPVWALLVMAATRRERHHFPDHLYFSLHAHAAFFGVFTVGELLRVMRLQRAGELWVFVDLAFAVWYTVVALHTMYGGSWWRAGRRAFGVLSVYAVVMIAVFVVLFSAALLV